MGTSLDGIATLCCSGDSPDRIVAVPVEIKTHQSCDAVTHLNEALEVCRRWHEIEVRYDSAESMEQFSVVIKDHHDRIQLLNHVAVTSAPFVIYCECTIEEIQRMVIVKFDPDIIRAYRYVIS